MQKDNFIKKTVEVTSKIELDNKFKGYVNRNMDDLEERIKDLKRECKEEDSYILSKVIKTIEDLSDIENEVEKIKKSTSAIYTAMGIFATVCTGAIIWLINTK